MLDLNRDLYMLEAIIKELDKKCCGKSVSEVETEAKQIANKILKTAYTLRVIIKECHDYCVAQAILRVLADSVASFVIVYGCKNQEEREIRHYLFVLDGVRQHKNSLEEKLKSVSVDESCPSTIANNLQSKIDQCQILIKHCDAYLEQIKDKSQWGDAIDILRKNAYWKFTNLKKVNEEFIEKKKTKKNLRKISWESLYERVYHKGIIEFLSSELSQFVHGLANSYISYGYSTETENLLCGISSGIMEKFSLTIVNIYLREEIKPFLKQDE